MLSIPSFCHVTDVMMKNMPHISMEILFEEHEINELDRNDFELKLKPQL